ncbi:hypothetical protein SAMN02745116_02595 [Pilibacter termitis]|uniref:Competence protein ComGD n=1 Tax=Pilibacter termitis TaxID=263852 RepID=A0A1T4RH03_9ENTE|nr:competence type IV pilus minor pilin ComGD [Pilibacter termitis]SKA15086.1 hypothetical protein SAMN02745116_02595 [Pilibacter termitis]
MKKFLKAKLTRRVSGFTVFESLVVITLVLCFVLIPTLYFHRVMESFTNRSFFYEFERGLTHIQSICAMRRQVGQVRVQENEVSLSSNNYQITLFLPEEIRTINRKSECEIIEISSKGTNSSLPKIVFENARRKEQIIYQFQFGTGKFRKEIVSYE